MKGLLTVSGHAADRWRERVDPSLTWDQAADAIRAFAARGSTRTRPRRWTRTALAPGDTYLYCADQPLVCLVVAERVVVTVLTPHELP